MAQRNVKLGTIKDVSGEVNIAAGDLNIYKGYTAEQVAILLTEFTSKFQPRPFDGGCPYKGLNVFEEDDASLFFGRDRLIEDLVSRIKKSRTIFITGPSGSGKSSLVRAGLIYALKQGAIKNLHSEHWLYETMRPGREPLEALALAFSRLKSPELGKYFRENLNQPDALHECAESALSERKNQRLVLFIDQFEEVFTQVGKDKVEPFLNLLTRATAVENGRVTIVFAMRSDFVSNCAMYPELNDLLNQQFVQIGAMQPDELVSAIALPALRVGLRIDPDLVAQIIEEMKGEPGVLPLMQFALKDLFDAQEASGSMFTLTLNDYLQRGGIHKALERHADNAFSKLSTSEQELARSIFSGLIEIGRGIQDTRRTAFLTELVPTNQNADEVNNVVQKLADARLITTDEQAGVDTIMISHEKLIDAWPWLKKLINENRDVIALQNEIASDAKEWEEHKRDSSYLYAGARLINVQEQMSERKLSLGGLAQEFVQKGVTRHRGRQLTLAGGILAIFAVLTMAVIIFNNQANTNERIANTAQAAEVEAVAQKATAQAAQATAVQESLSRATLEAQAVLQSNTARAGELAALALSEKDSSYNLALLLGVEGFRLEEDNRTYSSLFTMMDTHAGLIRYLHGHKTEINKVVLSPDGTMLASSSSDNNIILWDVSNFDDPAQKALIPGNGYNMEFSPNNKLLVSSDYYSKTIKVWDISDIENPRKISTVSWEATNQITSFPLLVFRPDGQVLISSNGLDLLSFWDMKEPSIPILLSSVNVGSIYDMTISPDGKTLFTGSYRYITIWDISDPKNIKKTKVIPTGTSVNRVVLNQDGTILVSSSYYERTILVWRVSSENGLEKLSNFSPHDAFVTDIALNANGTILATGSWDKTISLWDMSNPSLPIKQGTLLGHGLGVRSLSFAPDGKRMVSGGEDATVILWDLVKPTPIIQAKIAGHDRGVTDVSISPDNQILASSDFNNITNIWNVSDKQAPIKLASLANAANSIFDPTDELLATSSGSDVMLWDMREPSQPKPVATLYGHSRDVTRLLFNPKRDILISGSSDKTIIIWDVSNPMAPVKNAVLTDFDNAIFCLAINPLGNILASGSGGQITLWDITDSRNPRKITMIDAHSDLVASVAFSPDGELLASGGRDKSVILWNVKHPENPEKIVTLLRHGNWVQSVAFSPAQNILASSSLDGTIILWDLSDLETPTIKSTLLGHSDWIYSAIFSSDGKNLISASRDETIILWDLDTQSWQQKACNISGRNFSFAEWKQYFPNEPYRLTCPQWPAGQ